MPDPWIGFLNEEVAARGEPDRPLGRQFLRQEVLDRAACSFPFPLAVRFRGVVMSVTELEGDRFMVLGPAGLSEDALRVIGGVLVPCDRNLYPGSVVDVQCDLSDPDDYDLDEGLMAESGHYRVVVPIEP